MDTDEARIKLAEAMGWDRIATRHGWNGKAEALVGYLPHLSAGQEIPDPFTDANDDYAVLEWMRSDANTWRYRYLPYLRLTNSECGDYEVGDYAHAALSGLGSA